MAKMIWQAKQRAAALLVFLTGGFLFLSQAFAASAAGSGGESASAGGAVLQKPDGFNMWDAFLFRGDDISLLTLKEIIGDWSGLSPSIQPIFSEAMIVFNFAVLAFGSGIFAYTALAGTLQSAHDGQLLGKNWSTVWVPFRFTAGISLLIPTASGLCLAQLGMIWLLSQGVGLASNVWERAVSGYAENGGQYIAGKMATEGQIRESLKGVMINELCLAAMRRTGDPEMFKRTTDRSYFTGNRIIEWGGVEGSGYASDLCGSVEIDGSGLIANINEKIGETVSDAYSAAASSVTGSAFNFSETTRKTRKALADAKFDGIEVAAVYFENAADDIMSISPDQSLSESKKIIMLSEHIASAYAAYKDAVANQISGVIQAENSVLTQQLIDSARRDGWFTAGTWFYQIARSNEELNSLISESPQVQTKIAQVATDMKTSALDVIDGLPQNEREQIEALVRQADALFARNTKSLSYEQINPGTHKTGILYTLQGINIGGVDKDGAYADAAVDYGYDPTNPSPAIIQLKNVGDYMISGAVAAFAISKVAESAASAKNGAGGDAIVSGLISKAGPVGKMLSGLGSLGGYASAILLFAAVALFATGIILAFWLPMLPFVNWIGGIIGWVVASLEMLIATPVWVAAHLHPEGEGVASRFAASGYMIILELLLRPVLMVFGLIIAIIIADPLLNFVASQFFHALATTGEDSTKLLIAWLMKIILFTVVCWIAVNFTFKAINSVPNGVMRWIGGMSGSNSDMGESVGENTRAMVVAGSHKMTGALQMGGAANKAKDAIKNATNGAART